MRIYLSSLLISFLTLAQEHTINALRKIILDMRGISSLCFQLLLPILGVLNFSGMCQFLTPNHLCQNPYNSKIFLYKQTLVYRNVFSGVVRRRKLTPNRILRFFYKKQSENTLPDVSAGCGTAGMPAEEQKSCKCSKIRYQENNINTRTYIQARRQAKQTRNHGSIKIKNAACM